MKDPYDHVPEFIRPFAKLLGHIDTMRLKHPENKNDRPLFELMPAEWPTVGELRALLDMLPIIAAASEMHEHVLWVTRLFGTNSAKGQQELAGHVAALRAILVRVDGDQPTP